MVGSGESNRPAPSSAIPKGCWDRLRSRHRIALSPLRREAIASWRLRCTAGLKKAYAFLRAHEDDLVLYKIRHGNQLTELDLSELERIMQESGEFKPGEISRAVAEAHGLGLFVRSVIGMDRSAATEALSAFTGGSTFTGNQLAFVTLLLDQLTKRGAVDPELLYEAPYTAVAPTGPDGLFTGAQVIALVATLRRIRTTAEAS